jgi:hypothetical protein
MEKLISKRKTHMNSNTKLHTHKLSINQGQQFTLNNAVLYANIKESENNPKKKYDDNYNDDRVNANRGADNMRMTTAMTMMIKIKISC